MPGLPLLSAELPSELGDALLSDRPVPRAAGLRDGSMRSPVHALQHEFFAGWAAAEPGDSQQEKASGWVRLAVPLGSSFVLWTGIIGLVRALM